METEIPEKPPTIQANLFGLNIKFNHICRWCETLRLIVSLSIMFSWLLGGLQLCLYRVPQNLTFSKLVLWKKDLMRNPLLETKY